jgi:hypothetical protein
MSHKTSIIKKFGYFIPLVTDTRKEIPKAAQPTVVGNYIGKTSCLK